MNTTAHHHDHEDGFDQYLHALQKKFEAMGNVPLFTTDAHNLWSIYQDALPARRRQHYNCSACRQFIQRFGGLVRIDKDGNQHSAIWSINSAAPAELQKALNIMQAAVETANVVGAFKSAETLWGTPNAGGWTHLAVKPPEAMVFKNSRAMTAGQKMAQLREDFGMLRRSLEEFSQDTVATALRVLELDQLYRSEKVLGVAKWLADLKASIGGKGNITNRQSRNLVWLAVATAPAGFCHVRSSMIGTLLEDIQAGMGFDEVSRRFAAKMHPLRYQRPQAAPKAGNIAQAEKLVADLGLAPAFKRRIAHMGDVSVTWCSRGPGKVLMVDDGGAAVSSVFGHLTPKQAPPPAMALPTITMTVRKFVETVVERAERIQVMIASTAAAPIIYVTTEQIPGSPRLFHWDHPLSWFVFNGGTDMEDIGLTAGGPWREVSGITRLPARLGENADRFEHHGDGLILLLDGAKFPKARSPGSCIFPEHVRGDLHGVRATIEAHSRRTLLADHGTFMDAAIGYDLRKGSKEAASLRVQTGNVWQVYKLDRWD